MMQRILSNWEQSHVRSLKELGFLMKAQVSRVLSSNQKLELRSACMKPVPCHTHCPSTLARSTQGKLVTVVRGLNRRTY